MYTSLQSKPVLIFSPCGEYFTKLQGETISNSFELTCSAISFATTNRFIYLQEIEIETKETDYTMSHWTYLENECADLIQTEVKFLVF
jgi:hypothetical protein